MTNESIIHLVLTGAGWVAGIATMRSQLGTLRERVDKHDDCLDGLDVRFVPRLEMQARLDSINEALQRIAADVRLALSDRLHRSDRNNPNGDGR